MKKRFCELLKEYRKTAKMSQASLSKKSGVSQAAISAYELETRDPKWANVKRLAAALGVDENIFLQSLPLPDVSKVAPIQPEDVEDFGTE